VVEVEISGVHEDSLDGGSAQELVLSSSTHVDVDEDQSSELVDVSGQSPESSVEGHSPWSVSCRLISRCRGIVRSVTNGLSIDSKARRKEA
jgi:hypothetical protein